MFLLILESVNTSGIVNQLRAALLGARTALSTNWLASNLAGLAFRSTLRN